MENIRRPILPADIHKLKLPNKPKSIYKRHGKPPYSYAGMIIAAIMSSPKKMLSLSEIHDYLWNMFDFFKQPYTGWKDSVRHNLSHSKCFVKSAKTPNGKNNCWSVDLSMVTPSFFRRQHTAVSKDGNYAEDLHDELQIPRTDIPFFNYAKGSSIVRQTSSRSISSSGNSLSSNDVSVSMPASGHPASIIPSTNSDQCDERDTQSFNLNRRSSPSCFTRPTSSLSTTSSSSSRVASSEQSDVCFSPAFSDISEPRTPDNLMSGFRPIDSDSGKKTGWITPISMLREGSDMTRGANCLSDVSPSRSECSSVNRPPKRKIIRHRPRARKATKLGANDSFSKTDYLELQELIAKSANQWEVSIDKAIGNLRVLCQGSTEAAVTGQSTTTVCQPTNRTLTFIPGKHQSTYVDNTYCGNDHQMTIQTSSGNVYVETDLGNTSYAPRTPVSMTTDQDTYFSPPPQRYDHTYSSPNRQIISQDSRTDDNQVTPSDCASGFWNRYSEAVSDEISSSNDVSENSLEKFADCALWYSMIGSSD